MSFDLASLDALSKNQEDGRPLAIKHPVSGEPIGFTVHVASYESARVKKVQRRQINDRIKNQRKRVTAEDIERNGREVQVAAVISWDFADGFTIDNDLPACTEENVERILKRFPFIAEQVDSFASDQSSFLES